MSKVNKLSQQHKGGSFSDMLKNPFGRASPPRQIASEPSISAISSTLASTTAPADNVAATEEKGVERRKKKVASAPPGTFEYVVKEGDKIRSLAAQFDTTPSVLKKLNKLTMDFLYPDQVLRIPDADYAALNSPASNDKTASELPCKLAKEEASPKKSAMVFPGHIVRSEGSCHSIVDELELPPRPLSQDEAEYLDQECFERFIKIDSMYITEHNGSVDGVLLVTPNAVMFDPNVSNPVVIEKGADEFGMIAKMDTIMSASIFHDMETMENLSKRKSDPTAAKPSVYHSTSPEQQLSNDNDVAFSLDETGSNASDSLAAINADSDTDKATDASVRNNDLTAPSSQDTADSDDVGSVKTNSNNVGTSDTENGSTMAQSKRSSADLLLTPASLTMPTTNSSSVLTTANVPDNCSQVEPSAEVNPSEKESGGDSQSSNTDKSSDELASSQKPIGPEPSLFLCLRVGQPINKTVSTSCPIQSYNKIKRPEYWFSVPRDKVDILYAFFVQWKPEVYDPDDVNIDNGGFIAITEEGSPVGLEGSPVGLEGSNVHSMEPEHVAHHLGCQVSLDWEIISWDEVRRRRTIDDFEKYVQLPELKAESQIITETHIKQLVRCLPARIEGCPWGLAFGSEQHGFSLHQMYRNMNNLDCPVLLVILTTDDQIFGALSSCPFHMSELFYGTGESFLFTFVDGFKTYSWTGANNFFNKGDQTCLSIGSGEGSYGIWVDGDMYLGRTQNCQTYANDPLTGDKEDFHIKKLEIWSFHDD